MVCSRQEFYQTLHEHRDEFIASLRLDAIFDINSALTAVAGKDWLPDFLHIGRKNWDDLVGLSEALTRRSGASPGHRELRRQAYLKQFCACTGLVLKKTIIMWIAS